MACGIRQNDKIVGIQLPAMELPLIAKINQFVNDTQLFVQNETSLPHIFKELSNYEKASGAIMNKGKTVGFCIGTLKGKNPEYKEIKWTITNVNTLGVYHGNSINKDNIWRDKINRIKCALHVLKSRNLTIEGKLLLLKTFVFSIITFELEINGIPEKYCTEIENVMLDFMWSSRKHRVSRNTLQRPKSNGGFNLYSVRDIELALTVKMI